MLRRELDSHLMLLKAKDEKTIKEVELSFQGNTKRDQNFVERVRNIQVAMNTYVYFIADVLKDYLDNLVAEAVFERPFSLATVISILQDEEFVGFLISSNLIRRTLKLNYGSKGEVKLRVYIAILNFDNYKKGV